MILQKKNPMWHDRDDQKKNAETHFQIEVFGSHPHTDSTTFFKPSNNIISSYQHDFVYHRGLYEAPYYNLLIWMHKFGSCSLRDIHFIKFLKSAYTKLESSWENLYILLYIVQAYSTNLNILRILNAMLMDDDCYLCTTSIKLFISSHLTAPCH